jgi:hypothetical protein
MHRDCSECGTCKSIYRGLYRLAKICRTYSAFEFDPRRMFADPKVAILLIPLLWRGAQRAGWLLLWRGAQRAGWFEKRERI